MSIQRRTIRVMRAMIVASTCAIATRVAAQAPTTVAWTNLSIPSAKLGGERTVYVVTPPAYDGVTPLPVLVLLDADDRPQFEAAVANLRFLASRRSIRPTIIVGIPNGATRTMDLTPPATGSRISEAFGPSGGADKFLDFVAEEALPAVRAKYRTTPYTILAGHSLGGLVVVHAAATRPGLFSAGIAMSASLWWKDSTLIAPYASAIAGSSKPMRLFLTSGGMEAVLDGTVRRFAAALESQRPRTVAWRYQRYPADAHTQTPMTSLTDGLRFVFEPVSLAAGPLAELSPTADSAAIMTAFNKTLRDYAKGAVEFGVDPLLPEPFVRQVGLTALHGYRQRGAALAIMRRQTTDRPDAPTAHDALGDILLAAADTTGAKAEFQTAITLATAQKDAILTSVAEKLRKLGAPRPQH